MKTEKNNSNLTTAKFKYLDFVKKVDGRDKKIYRICDTVLCGRNLDIIGYTLLFEKKGNVYMTIYAIVENALKPLEPIICPCCGSSETYFTEAIHCTRCAETTEI